MGICDWEAPNPEVVKKQIEELVNVFSKYNDKALSRLPAQFDPNNVDPIRLSIDCEVLEALDLKAEEDELVQLYKMVYENIGKWVGE
jgi:hypothetical protein